MEVQRGLQQSHVERQNERGAMKRGPGFGRKRGKTGQDQCAGREQTCRLEEEEEELSEEEDEEAMMDEASQAEDEEEGMDIDGDDEAETVPVLTKRNKKGKGKEAVKPKERKKYTRTTGEPKRHRKRATKAHRPVSDDDEEAGEFFDLSNVVLKILEFMLQKIQRPSHGRVCAIQKRLDLATHFAAVDLF